MAYWLALPHSAHAIQDKGRKVGPRFYLLVSDVYQGNEDTVRVQNFLA